MKSKNGHAPTKGALELAVEKTERETIHAYLKEHGGNLLATAKALGIGARTLDMKIDKYGLREVASVLRARDGTIPGPHATVEKPRGAPRK